MPISHITVSLSPYLAKMVSPDSQHTFCRLQSTRDEHMCLPAQFSSPYSKLDGWMERERERERERGERKGRLIFASPCSQGTGFFTPVCVEQQKSYLNHPPLSSLSPLSPLPKRDLNQGLADRLARPHKKHAIHKWGQQNV